MERRTTAPLLRMKSKEELIEYILQLEENARTYQETLEAGRKSLGTLAALNIGAIDALRWVAPTELIATKLTAKYFAAKRTDPV